MGLNPEKICETNFPIIKPEDAAALYLTSREFEKDPTLKKPLDFENARESLSLDLVKSKLALRSNNERLKATRESRKVMQEELDRKWMDLRTEESELQKSFLAFEKFVEENEEKRKRALEKIRVETEAGQIHDEATKTTTEEKTKLLTIKTVLEREIKRHAMYRDYLNAVVKKEKDIKSIHELMEQYDALTVARKTLSKKQETDLERTEALRNDTHKFIAEKVAHLTGLKNDLLTMERRYSKAKRDVLHWEEAVRKVLEAAAGLASEVSSAKVSINRLYTDLCGRRGVKPEFASGDFENQLRFVKTNLMRIDVHVRNVNVHKESEDVSA